jgi:hypothetical protein
MAGKRIYCWRKSSQFMTNEEWQTAVWHAQGRLWALRRRQDVMGTEVGRRRLRLFACGYCRLVWDCLGRQ